MRLMITTLAFCVAALLGATQATAGALQSPATAAVAGKAVPESPACNTERRGTGGSADLALATAGYRTTAPILIGRDTTTSPTRTTIRPPVITGTTARTGIGYYGYRRRHRHRDDDWDD